MAIRPIITSRVCIKHTRRNGFPSFLFNECGGIHASATTDGPLHEKTKQLRHAFVTDLLHEHGAELWTKAKAFGLDAVCFCNCFFPQLDVQRELAVRCLRVRSRTERQVVKLQQSMEQRADEMNPETTAPRYCDHIHLAEQCASARFRLLLLVHARESLLAVEIHGRSWSCGNKPLAAVVGTSAWRRCSKVQEEDGTTAASLSGWNGAGLSSRMLPSSRANASKSNAVPLHPSSPDECTRACTNSTCCLLLR